MKTLMLGLTVALFTSVASAECDMNDKNGCFPFAGEMPAYELFALNESVQAPVTGEESFLCTEPSCDLTTASLAARKEEFLVSENYKALVG